MLSVYTNAEEILQAELARIRSLEALAPLLVVEAAQITRDEVAARIQRQGLNTAGQAMRGKRAGYGAYSRQWGAKRDYRGLQVDHIDFTFDGILMDNWSVLTSPNGNVAIGFRDDRQADIAAELEGSFGEAFGPALGELEKGTQRFIDRSNQVMM